MRHLRALGYHLLSWLHPQGIVYNSLDIADINDVCVPTLGIDKALDRRRRSPESQVRRSSSRTARG
eukprot:4305048-Alexandrium_andersonii.AAC.1